MFMRIKSVVLGVAIVGGCLMAPKGVFAAIGAEEIYKQASLDNQYYLNVLKRYGRVIDVVDVEKIHMTKEEFNSQLGELGTAIREKQDAKIAEVLENAVIPFLTDLSEAAK